SGLQRVRLAPVVGRTDAVVHQDQRAGHPGGRRGRAEPRVLSQIRARCWTGAHSYGIRQATAELDGRLHARPPAVRGRGREVGVALERTVHRLAPHVIAADAAPPVVVDLEVAGLLVEAVQVEQIVGDVAPAEVVRQGGVDIVLRVLVEVYREVEVQPGSAVRLAAGVGVIAGIPVRVGVHVVAARDREVRTRTAGDIVPPERGSGAVGGVRLEDPV